MTSCTWGLNFLEVKYVGWEWSEASEVSAVLTEMCLCSFMPSKWGPTFVLLASWSILNSQRIFMGFIHCAPHIVNNHAHLLKEVISLEGGSLHSCQSPLEVARRDISMKVCCMFWQIYWCHCRALYFVDVSNCQSSQLPLCSSGLLFQVEHCSVGDLRIHIWVYVED